jgi:hypothetical protein
MSNNRSHPFIVAKDKILSYSATSHIFLLFLIGRRQWIVKLWYFLIWSLNFWNFVMEPQLALIFWIPCHLTLDLLQLNHQNSMFFIEWSLISKFFNWILNWPLNFFFFLQFYPWSHLIKLEKELNLVL